MNSSLVRVAGAGFCTLVDGRTSQQLRNKKYIFGGRAGLDVTARGTFENKILESRVEC